MSLSAGHRLNHFEILTRVGAGAMGEVYKARDTRLNRLVAIKISKEVISDRCEREARAISGLNHPHICTPDHLGFIGGSSTVSTKNVNHAARTPERDAIQCHRGSLESALAGN
jgi:serine/threonine protein kinase